MAGPMGNSRLSDWSRAASARLTSQGVTALTVRLRMRDGCCQSIISICHAPAGHMVVRGGVEPPTFRFSGLRVAVQARSRRSSCLAGRPR
jgi:hypothetical protein